MFLGHPSLSNSEAVTNNTNKNWQPTLTGIITYPTDGDGGIEFRIA